MLITFGTIHSNLFSKLYVQIWAFENSKLESYLKRKVNYEKTQMEEQIWEHFR